MGLDFVAEVMTLVMAMLAIIWNQQRTTNGLRGEVRQEIRGLRGEMNEANRGLRGEMNNLRGEVQKLGDGLTENGRRLARIEGHLGIEVLPTTASETTKPALTAASGVALAGKTEISPT